MAETLNVRFEKRFSAGVVIRGEFATSGAGVTVLFGPSGCGKTTVLRCVAGLERPEAGTITVGGEAWLDTARRICRPPQQRGVGFVFQDYALFPHLTVAANIAFGLREREAAARRRTVDGLLERFSLHDLADRRPRQLSGGQQQRVALARALACGPRLLLLDEPLSALDTALRADLGRELRRHLVACGIPVLLVTHDRQEALALGDGLVVMSGGRVLQHGPVLDVFNRPADPEAARIVGVDTLLAGRITDRSDGLVRVQVGGAGLVALEPAGATTDEVFVSIRGEDVSLQRIDESSSPRNHLRARVIAVHPGTPLVRIELDAGFPLTALVTRPACEELDLRPGAAVVALVKAPAVHLIPRG